MTADLSLTPLFQGTCDSTTNFSTRDVDVFAAGSWTSEVADHANPWETAWIDLGGEG